MKNDAEVARALLDHNERVAQFATDDNHYYTVMTEAMNKLREIKT